MEQIFFRLSTTVRRLGRNQFRDFAPRFLPTSYRAIWRKFPTVFQSLSTSNINVLGLGPWYKRESPKRRFAMWRFWNAKPKIGARVVSTVKNRLSCVIIGRWTHPPFYGITVPVHENEPASVIWFWLPPVASTTTGYYEVRCISRAIVVRKSYSVSLFHFAACFSFSLKTHFYILRQETTLLCLKA